MSKTRVTSKYQPMTRTKASLHRSSDSLTNTKSDKQRTRGTKRNIGSTTKLKSTSKHSLAGREEKTTPRDVNPEGKTHPQKTKSPVSTSQQYHKERTRRTSADCDDQGVSAAAVYGDKSSDLQQETAEQPGSSCFDIQEHGYITLSLIIYYLIPVFLLIPALD